ncbi:MAG: selenite/tellurite reduction operon porin ExtI [Spirochaetota bacterium]
MKLSRLLVAIALVVGLAAPSFAADGIAKFTFGDDQYLELHYLLQVQAYSQYKDGKPESDYWSKDTMIRRSRIIVKGQAAQGVEFFMETDAPKQENDNNAQADVTKNGKYLFTQDAYIDFTIAKELKIAFGHILLPFMHHNRQSAVTLLCADYTAAIVPVGGNVWRDTGIEFRGLLANGLIDYRIGVWDGKDRDTTPPITNKNDMPRYTGRVQVNLKDAEEGFFYSGNYLGKKSIISFGFGVDYQQDVYVTGITKAKDYTAWTVDVYFDHPIGANNVLTLQGAYVNVKNGVFGVAAEKANMYFAEGGFLINGTWQPVARYYYKETENGTKSKISEIAGGLNYFIKGHNANIKVEYAQQLKDESDDFKNKQITVQCQIFI